MQNFPYAQFHDTTAQASRIQAVEYVECTRGQIFWEEMCSRRPHRLPPNRILRIPIPFYIERKWKEGGSGETSSFNEALTRTLHSL
jgi:hypothetical protein